MNEQLARAVEAVAREAGRLLLASFRRPMTISYKGEANPVTVADTQSESLIRQRLEGLVEGATFLGEEGGGNLSGLTWVVDPLDGTTNYAHGFPWFSVSIALVRDGEPVLGVIYHPCLDECFSAWRGAGAFCNGASISVSGVHDLEAALLTTGFYYHKGALLSQQIRLFERVHQRVQAIRRPGSAALDLAYVAAGFFDGFWERGLAPWDVAAGYLLVREAGGMVTDWQGRPARLEGQETVATNGKIHHQLLECLRGDPHPS